MKQSVFFRVCEVLLIFGLFGYPVLSQQRSDDNSQSHHVQRYVTGTGGIIGAHNSNYVLLATAGEAIAGGMHNENIWHMSGFWHQPVVSEPVKVEPDPDAVQPTEFKVFQNYPNPFNPQTTLVYDLPHPCKMTITVYNTVGQKIRLLLNEHQSAGQHQIVWDASDDRGHPMGSGLYVIQLTAFDEQGSMLVNRIIKVLLLK